MALANIPILVPLVILALCGVCYGAIYQVGDSNGWTSKGVDYKIWSSTKNFTIGDILNFKYDRKKSNVVRVLHKEFRSCYPKHAVYRIRSGNDYIRLTRPGNFFFISSVNGSCRSGQKVHVSVTGSVPGLCYSTAPKVSPVPTTSPIGSRIVSPITTTTTAPSMSSSPIAAPTPRSTPIAAPANSPMADGPSSVDYSPPNLPLELIPAPSKAAPPTKSSAQSIHASMLFLMAMGFIAYFMV